MFRRLLPTLAVCFALVAFGCGSDDGDSASDDPSAEPADFSGRGPYAVGQVDLQLDADHLVAVFYPVEPDAVTPDAEPYTYSGEDILDPAISAILPGSLSGEVAPRGHLGRPARQRRRAVPHGAAQSRVLGQRSGSATSTTPPSPRGGMSSRRSIIPSEACGRSSTASWRLTPTERNGPTSTWTAISSSPPSICWPSPTRRPTHRWPAWSTPIGWRPRATAPAAVPPGTAAYDERVDLWIGQAPGTPLAARCRPRRVHRRGRRGRREPVPPRRRRRSSRPRAA